MSIATLLHDFFHSLLYIVYFMCNFLSFEINLNIINLQNFEIYWLIFIDLKNGKKSVSAKWRCSKQLIKWRLLEWKCWEKKLTFKCRYSSSASSYIHIRHTYTFVLAHTVTKYDKNRLWIKMLSKTIIVSSYH